MKIIKNEQKIKRNATIGNWTSLAAIIILAGALYIVFTNQTNTRFILYAYIAFIVGFVLMQIGLYMGIRYGRSPRPDERLDAALKGLPGDYTFYHYTTPASHLLVGPAGVWVVLPYHQRGQVNYEKKRWRISGGGFLQAYMSIFGQEGLGRPDLDAEGSIRNLKKYFARQMDESAIPQIEPLLVFTHDEAEIVAAEAPISAVKLKQIKDFIRQKGKERKLPAQTITDINAKLQ